MKATRDTISPVGLTVLYEPEDPHTAVADIVFVAGMGGHPVTTWLYSPPPPPQPSKIPRRTRSFRSRDAKVLVKQPSKSSLLRRTPSLSKAKSASNLIAPRETRDPKKSAPELTLQAESEVYWPLDLLPRACPEARVLTWGCRAITLGGRMARAQNDVFAHADDLVQELALLRGGTDSATRPVMFIAHSLGGIILKEVLRRSEADYDHARNLLSSTSAILFLACPHRATEHGSLAAAVRSMASVCLDVPPGDSVLQLLTGSTGVEVEAGREAFEAMWSDWNFGVRCFAEGMGGGEGLELRKAAASIGERAEVFDASHLDMCRFRSSQDPNYKAILSSLSSYILNETHRKRKLNHKEKECLAAILPSITNSDALPAPYPGTCLWLYNVPAFQSWHHRQGPSNKLLWIKGRPGSGKSVVLRSLRDRLEKQWGPAGGAVICAAAEGRDLDTVFYLPARTGGNPAGVYRSLLAQLFPHDPKLRRALLSLSETKPRCPDGMPPFSDAELVSFFLEEYIAHPVETPTRRTFILIDVSDDCAPSYLSDLLSHLAQLARNSPFTICLASSDYASVTHPDTLEVFMSAHNGEDISRYVSLNLLAEWEGRAGTVRSVAARAGGVFLWAEIVVNVLNAAVEEGAMRGLIESTVAEMPGDLEGLYEWIIGTLNETEKSECLALMQAVLLAPESPRLNDLRVAARLARPWGASDPAAALEVGPPTSLRGMHGESPYQFHRNMRSRSVGLLELEGPRGAVGTPLGLRRVRPIHGSVRAFFLSGRGHACLAGSRAATVSFADAGHCVLLRACLDYLNLSDFPLGNATSPPPLSPASPRAKAQRRNVSDQRQMITSSYPFLQYSATHLLYHLLSPSTSRTSLPQLALLRVLARDNLRLYKRWTALLGASTPGQILLASGSAGGLLVRFPAGRAAVERVLRALYRLSGREMVAVGMGRAPVTPSTAGSGTALWSAVGTPVTPATPFSFERMQAAF